MSFWPGFWTVFLVLTVLTFVVLAVVVTIGGFFDLKSMFKRIEEQHRQDRK